MTGLTPERRAELRRDAERRKLFRFVVGTASDGYPSAGYESMDEEMLALLDAADERDRLHEDHLAFTTPLGFGDGVTEPAARLSELVDTVHDALCDARDHLECPLYCGSCGERLAGQTCEHCHGSGCGPGTATGAYEECEWCAGIGKVHTGCADTSYGDLAAERARLAAVVDTLGRVNGEYAMEIRRCREALGVDEDTDPHHAAQALAAAVERVRALHERDGEGFCVVCDYMTPHPCPTIRALDGTDDGPTP